MTTSSQKAWRILMGTAMAATLVNCAPAKWNENPEPGQDVENSNEKTVVPSDPEGRTTRTYESKMTFRQQDIRPLDMTWVIDNSPSMKNDADHVRANFQKFVEDVHTEADLKLALISQTGTLGTQISLPLKTQNLMQINRYVWSTDSLEIAAATFCPASPLANTECAKIRANARTTDLGKIAGKLKPFLRWNSRKAFVIVTDDESRVTSDSFLAAFKEAFPGENPTISAFVGLGKSSSPCSVNEGAQYKNLAKSTGGQIFNVCDTDWTESFKKLTVHMIRSTAPAFKLPADFNESATLLSVQFNGLKLDPSLYSLTPEGLVIDPLITKTAGEATIRIQYQIDTP